MYIRSNKFLLNMRRNFTYYMYTVQQTFRMAQSQNQTHFCRLLGTLITNAVSNFLKFKMAAYVEEQIFDKNTLICLKIGIVEFLGPA